MATAVRPLTIMVVEDYDTLRDTICDVLSEDGHKVVGVPMAEDVDDTPTGLVCDLYIVDINLPGEDGNSLVSRLRISQPDAGIVIISARHSLADRIQGYSSGATTYLRKPLELVELRAVVRGFSSIVAQRAQGTDGLLTLRPSRMELYGPAGSARMSPSEIVLLAAFSRAVQQTLEHWQVASHLESDGDISKENMEVRMGRLRRKISFCGASVRPIQSIRGFGYRLCVPIIVMEE